MDFYLMLVGCSVRAQNVFLKYLFGNNSISCWQSYSFFLLDLLLCAAVIISLDCRLLLVISAFHHDDEYDNYAYIMTDLHMTPSGKTIAKINPVFVPDVYGLLDTLFTFKTDTVERLLRLFSEELATDPPFRLNVVSRELRTTDLKIALFWKSAMELKFKTLAISSIKNANIWKNKAFSMLLVMLLVSKPISAATIRIS